LLAVPVLNHLIAARVLNSLEVREWWGLYNTLVSANGLALLLAFALYVGLAFSRSPADETQSTEMRSTSDPQIAPPSMSSAALDQCRHSDDSHWDHPK
jgi:hypothetical protein